MHVILFHLPKQTATTPGALLAAFWKFLRPHTIRGTILGTTMVVTRALMASPEVRRGLPVFTCSAPFLCQYSTAIPNNLTIPYALP
jgi:hypothetical protein